MTAFKCHCYDGYEGKLCDQQSTSKQNITAISSIKTTPSPTTTPLEQVPCSYESWTVYQGSCYKHFANKLSFLEALFFCRNLTNKQSCPIDLVSIHSREENEFAAQLFFNDTGCVESTTPSGFATPWFWIGLYQPVPDSDFVWSDGTRVNYTSWRMNEPSDHDGIEDCTHSYFVSCTLPYGFEWNDLSCDQNLSFACKHPVLC
ncbi:lectin-like [Lytechinus variegatus]|uniref:lectin-like n=1 Tax=Lytechinus variegatus TaxID=7654 RepID=UPI001BB1A142|nr:lectin-like [Lytechinus variegatus]